MAKFKFTPSMIEAQATSDQKLLLTARKNQVPIRFGCASCRCGTCGVKVSHPQAFIPANGEELALLKRMNLSTNGDVRLACQAKATGSLDCEIDVAFQNTYSPDDSE